VSDQLPDELGEERPERPDEGHPIIAGLVALVGVAVAVGLILGLVVLGGTRLLGLGEDSGSSSSSAQRSLYVPKPEKTPKATEPKITLAPDGETATQTPTKEPTRSTAPRKQITLSASATSVAPMERLDLTGVYPGGEGAILRVERFADGSWQDFGVTASVGNEVFSTYVQTGVPGVNRFRMVDTDSGLESNEVRVTIG
jgi:hypothetical protein